MGGMGRSVSDAVVAAWRSSGIEVHRTLFCDQEIDEERAALPLTSDHGV
jgi:hypothetical protein